MAESDESDAIVDFEVGINVIGLADGLTFADLFFRKNNAKKERPLLLQWFQKTR